MQHIELFEQERASRYDQFISAAFPTYDHLISLVPGILKQWNKSHNEELLVAGCGTGNEIVSILDAGFQGNITALDPSPEMISQAKEKLSTKPNIDFFEGTVDQLDANKKYSLSTLLLVLHFIPDNGDKLNLLSSIAEKMQKGAPFLIADIFGTKEEILQNLQVLKCAIPPTFKENEVDEWLAIIAKNIKYIPENRLVELLEQAGFEKPLRFHQSSIYGAWITRKK